ncbi:MAG: (d)CMP kinase [Nanoarchaeota archaeon]|nr:(d)CMP kinase [Nanoarchaeota archaeon]
MEGGKKREKMIITIDGSSWTGKSTSAKALAKLMGYQYLNTGAMFRAIGYFVKKKGLAEEKDIIKAMKAVTMEFRSVQGESHLFLNGEDVAASITSNEVVSLASKVASIPAVREKLLELQRSIASQGGFVVEGRDTGTTVFPNADWKFFLDASMDVKVKRFFKMLPPGEKTKHTPEEVRKIIEDIDERDRTRIISPLTRAKDAIPYDNSESPTAEQDAIVMWYYITKKHEMISNISNINNLNKK